MTLYIKHLLLISSVCNPYFENEHFFKGNMKSWGRYFFCLPVCNSQIHTDNCLVEKLETGA